MYKIHRFLVVVVLVAPFALFSQQVSKRPATHTSLKPVVSFNNRNTSKATGPRLASQSVRSGPMAGYSDRREVMLRAQNKQLAHVQIRYHEAGGPSISRSTVGKPLPSYLTNEVYINRQTVFIAHLLADQVEPGKMHEYDVLIEGQKVSLPYPTPFQTQSLCQ
ncbi:hypothetical protein [Spirosoma flavum]|uniref:Uncharacterized protein n=1 Tax=Spirosoma flavum TaxID=2048557 RepID=A0ABW6ALX1_9BACT